MRRKFFDARRATPAEGELGLGTEAQRDLDRIGSRNGAVLDTGSPGNDTKIHYAERKEKLAGEWLIYTRRAMREL